MQKPTKLTIDIYFGERIEESSEKEFLRKLASDLAYRSVTCLIFANFFPGKTRSQVDFLVVTPTRVC